MMTATIYSRLKLFVLPFAGAMIVASLSATVAIAAEAPVKQIVSSHVGWDVNQTKTKESAPQSERNVCAVQSKDECQFGSASSEAGGLRFPEGIAVNKALATVSPEHGDVYVADTGNQRVQVLSPTGAFVLMFGWNVNKTKVDEGASQSERNVCTALSNDVCQTGVSGGSAGQFAQPTSITVDPATGNVYVEDLFDWRVQEFTATGEFVLTIGKNVDKTTKANLCTATSKDECGSGEQSAEGSTEPSAFKFISNRGQLLDVGGTEDLLYVGDQQRIEMFKADGTFAGEISLSAISAESSSAVSAITVDSAGDVYVAYEVNFAQNLIYELGPKEEELGHFEVDARQPHAPGAEIDINAIALDPAGRLAVAETERGNSTTLRGSLYEVSSATTLRVVTEFDNEFPTEFGPEVISGALSMAFDGEGDMYAIGAAEIISYEAVRSGEAITEAGVCRPGADEETDATVECELKAEVNTWAVSETVASFQWGKGSSFERKTESQAVAEGSSKIVNVLVGLLPDETYFYRTLGEDKNVKAPEAFSGETVFVTTEAVPPRVVGSPSTLQAGPFSAVMFAELNPENTNTTYEFEYGPCEDLSNCAGLVKSPSVESAAYGAIGTTVEVAGLLPQTLYHYRLHTKSLSGEATSSVGSFTTAPGPAVTATTGLASAVGTTTAVVSGEVNPDGQAATYTYELGRYNGAETQFGVVFSGSAGSGVAPLETSLPLSGLQPGTTYSYRIAIHAGDGSARGEAATGATLTFTTAGLPAVFTPAVPPQLEVPRVSFPAAPKPLTNAQKLATALKACKREHKHKKQRATCEKKAHKLYPVSKKK